MSLPQDLITTATLGTAQRELSDLTMPLLDQVEAADREKNVLVAAALLTIQAQAGWLIPHEQRTLADPAEKESTQTINPRAVRHLMVMLEGYYAYALSEWLSEVARMGRRVPEESLPLLLDAGRKHKDLRDLIVPILGKRGAWLAAQAKDKKWGWFLTETAEKSWEEGTSENRLQALEQLRKTNPAQARERVISVWEAGKAAEREKFINTFYANLSMEDEPFLEAALGDKAQGVRRSAANLLTLLPESRFHQRVREQVLPLLSFHKKQLVYELPDRLDQALRDGFGEIETEDNEIRRKWLIAMLQIVPPEVWRNQWQLNYEQLIAAAMKSEDALLYLRAWAQASYFARDTEFALHLLSALFERNLNKDSYAVYMPLIDQLIDQLPADAFETLVINILSKANSPLHPPIRSLLLSKHTAWSIELTHALLDNLRLYLQKGNVRPEPQLRDDLLHYALYMPISMREEVIKTLNVPTSAEKVWGTMVDEIRLLLDFRAEMLAAIHS